MNGRKFTCSPFYVEHLHVVFPSLLIFRHVHVELLHELLLSENITRSLSLSSSRNLLPEFQFLLIVAINVVSIVELDISFFHNLLFVLLVPMRQKTDWFILQFNRFNTLENSSAKLSIRVGSLRSGWSFDMLMIESSYNNNNKTPTIDTTLIFLRHPVFFHFLQLLDILNQMEQQFFSFVFHIVIA